MKQARPRLGLNRVVCRAPPGRPVAGGGRAPKGRCSVSSLVPKAGRRIKKGRGTLKWPKPAARRARYQRRKSSTRNANDAVATQRQCGRVMDSNLEPAPRHATATHPRPDEMQTAQEDPAREIAGGQGYGRAAASEPPPRTTGSGWVGPCQPSRARSSNRVSVHWQRPPPKDGIGGIFPQSDGGGGTLRNAG